MISQLEPMDHLIRRMQSLWDTKADEEVSLQDVTRWARLRERLAWVGSDAPLNGDHLVALAKRLPCLASDWKEWLKDPGELARNLREECAATARLSGIGTEIWTVVSMLGEKDKLRKVDVRRHVFAAARGHYRSLWSLLTDAEQLALCQLAKEGFISPRAWPMFEVLRRKGLVCRSPFARLMNRTFAEFVTQAEGEDQVRDWEHADGASAWDRVRNGILILLVVGGVVLYLTQPEALTRWLGAVAAIGSAAATVAHLFGFFGSAKPTAVRT